MLYFAYGSNMFTYRLEKRVGKTVKRGIGRLSGYKLVFNKLSKDGSLKANIAYTGIASDTVLGIIFEVEDKKIPILDKLEGGYKRDRLTIEKLGNDEMVDAAAYIAKPSKEISGNMPFDWYLQLLLAGAEEHALPSTYIDNLKAIPTKICENDALKLSALFVLQESKLIKKTTHESIERINTLNKLESFVITLPDHALHEREISVHGGNHQYKYTTATKIPKGVQTHRELNVDGKSITLKNETQTLYVQGKDLLIDQLNYDTDNLLKLINGTLNAFSTTKEDVFNHKYLRLIIPTERRLGIGSHMQSVSYTTNYDLHDGLLIASFNNATYHFYSLKHNNSCFVCIDSITKTELERFQLDCHTILLTYAFLLGDYCSEQGYFFSFEDEGHGNNLGVLYQSLQSSIKVKYPAFTTNPLIGLTTGAFKEEVDLTVAQEREKYNDLQFFPWVVFNNICELAVTNEKILRTLTFLVENQSPRQEINIPLQYITLETIAAVLSEGNKELKPIEDPNMANELLDRLTKTVTTFISEKDFKPASKLDPIIGKIKNLNSPLNADKLGKAFAPLGYTLTKEEKEFISNRNPFLHGSIRIFKGSEINYKDMFYLSLRLNFLIAVLLLKKAGFSGRIINYAKLYDYITDRYLDEDVLKLI